MRDYGPVKITCRILTLINYIIFLLITIFMEDIIDIIGNDKVSKFTSNNSIIIITCAIPLIIMMIAAIVIKYIFKDKSKVTPYRIIDVLTRYVSTLPISLIAGYYICKNLPIETIIKIISTVAVYVIINALLKYAFQETMDVSFINNDNL